MNPIQTINPCTQRSSLKRRARGREGMTLIEIMIVVIIMAMIAGAVGIAVLPQFSKAKIRSTKTDAQGLRAAVTLYYADGGKNCPSVQDLVAGKYLDATKRTKDAWDNDFSIRCEGTEVYVVSAGPDGQLGNEDDIQ